MRLYSLRFSHDKAAFPDSAYSGLFGYEEFVTASQRLESILRFRTIDIDNLQDAQETPVRSVVIASGKDSVCLPASQFSLDVWNAYRGFEYRLRGTKQPIAASVFLAFDTPDRMLFSAVTDHKRLTQIIDHVCDVDKYNLRREHTFYKLSAAQSQNQLPTYH